ncbi:hypothetical protein DYQ86_07015 [Acidobacteria bacterium AB60]|nr:hypothetical protein DYQ86_07015 [Acidobacteria bacterium AB60]
MRGVISWISARSRHPLFLLGLAAGLVAFVVQSGELGSADTQHRLQSAHSFWTSEPPVFPNEYPEFGIHGRDGSLQSWYGIGQSLLLLPFDIAGTYLERLPVFADYNGDDPSVRNIFVSGCVNILLSVLTALVCFRLLRLIGFLVRQSVGGVLGLLLLTTHLHYTQNMMENNYICLLTICGLTYQLDWTRMGRERSLLVGSFAFGLNLLTRLTTGLDLLAGALFVVLVLHLEGWRGRAFWGAVKRYAVVAGPVYAVFGLLDRLYQYHRFGSFFNTYVSVVAREARARNPLLPASYPFETPFHVGFFGALFSRQKSIFLFDPLLILMLLLIVIAWHRFNPAVRAYVIASGALLLAYLCFYARYTVWSGDFAWGDRYVSTAVELASLLAVPLLMKYFGEFGRLFRAVCIAIVAASAAIQAASLAFWLPLEIYQRAFLGTRFVVGLRFENIVGFAIGKMQTWGLFPSSITDDPWDYVHISCWNFLPFLLARVGAAPRWVVHVTLGIWLAGLSLLGWVLWRVYGVIRSSATEPA